MARFFISVIPVVQSHRWRFNLGSVQAGRASVRAIRPWRWQVQPASNIQITTWRSRKRRRILQQHPPPRPGRPDPKRLQGAHLVHDYPTRYCLSRHFQLDIQRNSRSFIFSLSGFFDTIFSKRKKRSSSCLRAVAASKEYNRNNYLSVMLPSDWLSSELTRSSLSRREKNKRISNIEKCLGESFSNIRSTPEVTFSDDDDDMELESPFVEDDFAYRPTPNALIPDE